MIATVYTDASFADPKAAFAVWLSLGKKKYLFSDVCPQSIESSGVWAGVKFALKHKNVTSLIVCCDCTSALNVFHTGKHALIPSDPFAKTVQTAIRKLKITMPIRTRWVKGHHGHKQNEWCHQEAYHKATGRIWKSLWEQRAERQAQHLENEKQWEQQQLLRAKRKQSNYCVLGNFVVIKKTKRSRIDARQRSSFKVLPISKIIYVNGVIL